MFVKLATLACALACVNAAWNGPLAGGLPASQVPAGISLQACPNYPNCANPNVAIEPNAPAQHQQYNPNPYYNQPAQPQYNPAQQYNSPPQYNAVPQYNPAPQYNQAPQYNSAPQNSQVQEALNRGEYIGDGDYHGEGLAESGADGNQQHFNANPAINSVYSQSGQYQPTAAPHYNQPANNVPAGVDPHSCPNYPYCS